MIGETVFLSFEDKQKRTPKNYGHWSGERGNSVFYSNKPRMRELGAECIRYINGEPDFTGCSIFVISIPSMTSDRFSYSEFYRSNFEQAYLKLSEELGKNESDVKKWLKTHQYTIHESNDLNSLYIIPTEIHKTYIHAGGVAECRCSTKDEEDDELIELIEKGL